MLPMDEFTEEDWGLVGMKIAASSVTNPETGCCTWTGSVGGKGNPQLDIILHDSHRVGYNPRRLLFYKPDTTIKMSLVVPICGDRLCIARAHAVNKAEEAVQKADAEKRLREGSIRDLVTGCLLWQGRKNGNYGTIGFASGTWPVHRLAYYLAHGRIPDGIQVRHDSEGRQKCTNETCWNIEHLSLGDGAAQSRDMKAVGSMPFGEHSSRTLLSEATALAIKHSQSEGTKEQRAMRFGTTRAVVSMIDQGTSWSHLPDKNGVVDNSKQQANLTRERQKRKRVRDVDFQFTRENYTEAWSRLMKRVTSTPSPEEMKLDKPCLLVISPATTGYGLVGIGGMTKRRAHKVSAELHHNNCQKVPKGLMVRHLCGPTRKACVEPSHLAIGTDGDNQIDTIKHGKKGVKLNEEKVKRIKAQLNAPEPLSGIDIAREHGVSPCTISSIKSGQGWGWVTLSTEADSSDDEVDLSEDDWEGMGDD